MRERLFKCFPTVENVDVVVIDDIQEVSVALFEAFDATARAARDPDLPFGGIQLVVAGNFFELSPTAEAGLTGFLFQHPLWRETFPLEQTVALRRRDTYGVLVEKAHFGCLTDADVEAFSLVGARSFCIPPSPFVDKIRGVRACYTIFPRFRATQEYHRRIAPLYRGEKGGFRLTEIGGVLQESLMKVACRQAVGFVGRLDVEVNQLVQFNYGNGTTIETGDLGVVTEVRDHSVTVRLPLKGDRKEVVHAMRIRVYHPDYPDASLEMSQLPLVPRDLVSVLTIQKAHSPVKYVEFDPRWVLEVNSLGRTLSALEAPCISPTLLREYLQRPGVIHEPTKIAFEELYNIVHPNPMRYCRNCKTNIASPNFESAHWNRCIAESRWCDECDVGISLPLWESHAERHTFVRCFDCGKILQWRAWDTHRISCPGMLKEISPDNPFIPIETRSLSLAQGHDPKDLHRNVGLKNLRG